MIGIEKEAATGLMAFWANIKAEHEMAFLEWHNTEHIPERARIDRPVSHLCARHLLGGV